MKRKQTALFVVIGLLFWTMTGFASSYHLRKQGMQNAPVLLYVFSSLSCSHCAVFHQRVLPVLLERFVQTNQVQLIQVDMPATVKDLYATAIGRCLEERFYQPYVRLVFQQQRSWAYAHDFQQRLLQYANDVGADLNAVKTCMKDEFLINKIIGQRDNLSKLYKVRSLPSVVVVKQGSSRLIKGTDVSAITEQIQNIVESK